MSSFNLGDPVHFAQTLVRRYRSSSTHEHARKVWEPNPYTVLPNDGIVVGVRTLANGKLEYGYDAGNGFVATEHITAYIVAYAMRRKHVYVLPEHLTAAVDKAANA